MHGLILIGQYDSPFVRRVGIALHLHGIGYEHRPWSVFGDAERIRGYSPLGRVPVLVLADGTVLPDGASSLAWIDQQPSAAALLPSAAPARLASLRRTALALGLAEKAVALLYETTFHENPAALLIARMQSQIGAVLDALDGEAAAAAPFWQGDRPGHDDIALACAVGFCAAVHPALLHHPALARHSGRCESLPEFIAVSQEFRPPA